jgi:hypothetical protein
MTSIAIGIIQKEGTTIEFVLLYYEVFSFNDTNGENGVGHKCLRYVYSLKKLMLIMLRVWFSTTKKVFKGLKKWLHKCKGKLMF